MPDYGNRSEIMLPDGSLVKLNAGSEVVYSYDPKKKTREVDFQGEGFFDVSKSKILSSLKWPEVKREGLGYFFQFAGVC